MSSGEISLAHTPADLIFGSGVFSTLQFQGANQEPVTVMNLNDSRPAVRCKDCGHFMILTDPEYVDTHCLVCKALMTAGTTSCPSCGWSYRES